MSGLLILILVGGAIVAAWSSVLRRSPQDPGSASRCRWCLTSAEETTAAVTNDHGATT